ncbi:shikimate kinase [Gelatiniphilus marinus]|uniref:Shikimate kinase n=1 Tax=Gelatiniphilus marinus TaxID=1759464 RepID=A0ABW5JUF2_9FLAO
MIVVLIGYMASGKTSIGKKLANKLSYDFIDLDDLIEEKEKLSVTQVFKSKGEVYFRNQEHLHLKEVLSSKNNIVLSVGGGTPCYSNNMDIIVNNIKVKSIYLKASITTLTEKLMRKKAQRPLIAHIETEAAMAEFIGKHLFERVQFYNQAEIVLTVDNKTKGDIVEDIILKLF